MGETISERIVDALPFMDRIAEGVQPKVQEAVEAGGTTARNVLDGVWFEAPLHPALTDVPVGSWTAALVFDGLDAATGSRAVRNAADASLAVGVVGGLAAATTGLSDWRYLSGGSRRMGVAHGLLNTIALLLSVVSLVLRATGRRNAGRLVFLAGYSISGVAAHIGGELSYSYALRVNRNVFQGSGPDEFVPVLDEEELPQDGMRRVEVDGAGILLSRSSSGEVCAISSVCGHFGGPLEQGDREGDTVVCPWHRSRFDLDSGEAIDGPAVFPQSRYETRVRDGKIEVKAAEENVQKKVM
ncbi:MAG: Rieske 2Fe-2S domain-containing protein [Actinomycetota bacterium]|nr:Rieske 2Fe-2S domain-containing protein [Actinomycetota bacterium]